jgi:hypothetical protein
MEEFETVRQDRTGFKRYFFDDSFDLYVWYDNRGGMITGFQLVYDKKATPRAITWIKNKGIRHDKVDGLDSSYYNQTPLLVRDGIFDIEAISDSFREHSKGIDEGISTLVYNTLKQYDPRLDDQFI